jgi:sugar phosphate isomerase/epimerase
MITLGANTVLFAGYDLETALQHIAWAGYDGAELSAIQGMCEHLVLDDWRSQVTQIRELAEKYGLQLTAMEEARLDDERLQKAYEAAAELGIPVVNVGPGGKAGSDDDLARQIDLLAAMAEKAHAHGVTLCAKAHVGQSIHDTPTTLRAMAQIDSPGFGVDMDPSHIFRADGGEDVVEALRAVISRVRHVHIRDCPAAEKGTEGPPGKPEEQACGRGGIDLAGYLRVLHAAGAEVAVNLEVIGAKEYELSRVATIAAESRGYLNACWKAATG